MKKVAKVRRIRRIQRAQNGAALILAVCAVVIFFIICTPLVIFYANMSAQLTVQGQASHIASQTAQVVDDYKYWLDAPRPGFTQDTAIKTAEAAAASMGERIGLKDTKVTISFETDANGNETTICQLTADAAAKIPCRVNVFGFDMRGFFPGQLNVRGTNMHSAMQPYSLMHMDAPTIEDERNTRPLGFNQRDVAIIPTYGFFYNATGEAGNKNTVGYGKGLAKTIQPENFFSMNHYHLKRTDIDYVNQTGQDVQLNGWNSSRLINGEEVKFTAAAAK